MQTILDIAESIKRFNSPGLNSLTPGQLHSFITLSRELKRSTLLVQPAETLPDEAPEFLSTSIIAFLAATCQISKEDVPNLWSILRPLVWNEQPSPSSYDLFQQYGHEHGLPSDVLYPPHHTCKNTSCKRRIQGQLLTKVEQRHVVLYTLDRGAIPTKHVYLYCEYCKITYENNFYVEGSSRVYYDTIPDNIQVATHVFIERRVIDLFNNLANFSWTSFTNCARLYNLTLSHKSAPPRNFPFQYGLTSENVWDGFVIKALLFDHQRRNATLVVPKGGEQHHRFDDAIRARNLRFQMYGQPELRHYCNKCTRFFYDASGTLTHKTSTVVIDGVTVGHPCCAHHNCHQPLASNRHRFCPEHAERNTRCSIVGCSNKVSHSSDLPNSLTCSLTEHKMVERTHKLRGQSRFQLRERLLRARVAHPNDAIAEEVEDWSFLVDDELEEQYELDDAGEIHVTTEVGANPGRRLKAQFGRRRTHNEQLFVAPCGMIIARETFYGAEGVASVVKMIKRVYRTGGLFKPDHIFFDNNCMLSKMVKNKDPWFDDVGLSVDVFHFKCKHSETDTYCQLHCNPEAFPELRGENNSGWYFNSSIAEQTNVWMGGYHAICREMRADRYAFFLDEMISQRNAYTKEKLKDALPRYWPTEE